ncbi:hypothetical protein G7054_g1171 [Neopestalotiopsis clavispora]|nr:hypothetical protein G7054_g1171 [Neopestalotiopsis clavispora]
MAILEKREVRTDKAPPPRPFYSQAVTVGNLVYTSGIVGIDPLTNEFVGGTVKERTAQTLRNISAILEEAGSHISQVVKVNVFLLDHEDFTSMNEAYSAVFDQAVKPVRTCVIVKRLPRPTDVEIECVAHL